MRASERSECGKPRMGIKLGIRMVFLGRIWVCMDVFFSMSPFGCAEIDAIRSQGVCFLALVNSRRPQTFFGALDLIENLG